jgi:hypothetical protein
VRGRVSVIAVVVLIGVLVSVDNVSACSCALVPVSKHMKRADGAFNGRLLSVEPAAGTSEAAFRYRVGLVAKGPFRRGRVVTVWSQSSDAVCGLERGIGDLYGLFVSRDQRRWRSGLCSTVPPRKMRRAARGAQLSTASGGACA